MTRKRIYPKEAICVVCNNTFYIQNSDQGKNKKTCSPDCRWEWNKKINVERAEKKLGPAIITKICIICHELFELGRENRDQKTCSIKCGHLSTGQTRKKKYADGQYYMGPSGTCPICNNNFKQDSHGQTFCSKSCMYKGRKPATVTQKRLEYIESLKGVKRDPEIGKKISATNRAANRKGSNNPKWKFENASRDRDRKLIDYKNWRLAVYQRDNFTCVMCGITHEEEYIHADHIERWVDSPEKRFDINNGRTLCRKCHYFVTYNKIMPESSNWGKSLKYKPSKYRLKAKCNI